MTSQVAVEGVPVSRAAAERPYTPSWLDAIVDQIERLPGPTWLAYVALSAGAVALIGLEAALSSRGLWGQDPLYFGYAFFHVYPLAAYHILSRGALGAWSRFRPATDLSPATAARWQQELSTRPARPAVALWLATAGGMIALMLAFADGWDLAGQSLAFVALRLASECLWLWPVTMMLSYLLFRQLRLVSGLHRLVARVDLLRPAPLHAMSTLTARSALVLLPLMSTAVLPLPNLSVDIRLALTLVGVPFTVMALAAFFVPLRGMNAVLEAEKGRRLAEVSARIHAAVAALHDEVDAATTSPRDAESARVSQLRLDALTKAQTGLLQEREFIGKQSTWPWNASTLRAVLSAVALPIVLFLLTRALERFVL